MKMTLNEEIEYLQSGNWYDKVRTVLPTDEYLKLGWTIGDILETLELFRSLAPEPQTNADRIRAMTDEKLAVFLESSRGCPTDDDCEYGVHATPENCIKHWATWLQQPAQEDT